MSLSELIRLAETTVDLNDPAIKLRFEEIRKRQHKFDEGLERKAQLKEPSNELLNRSCSL